MITCPVNTVYTVDHKYVVLKIQVLNVCVTLCKSTVGTATMHMHRTVEKERRDKVILLKTVQQSHSPNQLSNIDRTSNQIMTEGCGQIDATIN